MTTGEKYSFRNSMLKTAPAYDGIISHIADLMVYLPKEGSIKLCEYLESESGKYNHPQSVLELIKVGCGLIADACDNDIFHFALEHEFSVLVRKNIAMSDLEFSQLKMTKQMLVYLRNFQSEEFQSFAAEFKSLEYNYGKDFYALIQKKSDIADSADVLASKIHIETQFEGDAAKMTANWKSQGSLAVTVLNTAASGTITSASVRCYGFDSSMTPCVDYTWTVGKLGHGIASDAHVFSYGRMTSASLTLTYALDGTQHSPVTGSM